MNIKILGTGCPNCQKLEANVKKVLEELKVDADLEKVTDIGEIMNYGVMGLPALVLNEDVKICGRVPNDQEIKALLAGGSSSEEKKGKCCSCSCGGSC